MRTDKQRLDMDGMMLMNAFVACLSAAQATQADTEDAPEKKNISTAAFDRNLNACSLHGG